MAGATRGLLTQNAPLAQLSIMARDGRLESYRLNAEKCCELAQTFKDLDAKRTMLAMADAWLLLAVQRERNVKLALSRRPVSESQTSPTNEPPSLRLDPAKPDDPMQC